MAAEQAGCSREGLEALLSGMDFSQDVHENMTMAPIIAALVKIAGYDLAIYGAGFRGFSALRYFRSCGVEQAYVIDRDPPKQGKLFFGIRIVGREEFASAIGRSSREVVGLIAADAGDNEAERLVITDYLRRAGCGKIFPRQGFNFNPYAGWAYGLTARREEFLRLRDLLADDESRVVLHEYLRAVMHDDIYRLPSISAWEKYFGAGIFELSSNEHLVTCGMEKGDTIFYFLAKQPEFGSILGIECDPARCSLAEANLALLPAEIRGKIEINCAWLGMDYGGRLDDLLTHRKATLITMDVEGCELGVLRGAKRIIAEQRPILAICAYHRQYDLLELPELLQSLPLGYRFYLRKYAWLGAGDMSSKDEMVLYAVPPHRLTSQ